MKKKYLTNAERLSFTLTPVLKDIIVGLSLGDLYIRKQKLGKNPGLLFEQGLIHLEYLNHLYGLFESYCPSVPVTSNRLPHKATGKVHARVTFQTYSLPCFKELHELFYSLGKKIVPANIGDLLTPLGLAYWICDDGSFHKSRQSVTLCTNSFTLEEVTLLAKTLNDKWDLKCAVHKSRDGFVIYISSKSLSILQNFLKDTMPSMMLYKIGL